MIVHTSHSDEKRFGDMDRCSGLLQDMQLIQCTTVYYNALVPYGALKFAEPEFRENVLLSKI